MRFKKANITNGKSKPNHHKMLIGQILEKKEGYVLVKFQFNTQAIIEAYGKNTTGDYGYFTKNSREFPVYLGMFKINPSNY
jgi:hypothetical protein